MRYVNYHMANGKTYSLEVIGTLNDALLQAMENLQTVVSLFGRVEKVTITHNGQVVVEA